MKIAVFDKTKMLQLNRQNLGWNLATLLPDGTLTKLTPDVCKKEILNNKVGESIARVLDDKIVKIYAIPTSPEESEFYYIGSDTGRQGRFSLFRWAMRRIVANGKKRVD
ncbi:MAG: hypothetical protein IKW13_07290 [Thermoguttaceae bacterium]|nr:hypothetical protein [Thermoguttaceae bacterium]